MEIIQIIEDEPAHASLLDHTLRKARYRTNVALDGEIGLLDVKRLNPALVLLDVMLPGVDGYEICRRLREDPQTQTIPIILLTALGSEEHRVAGLELGADDYIIKPFSPREVVSRVRAVLRRARPLAEPQEECLDGDMVLEDSRFVVSFRGKRVQLSSPKWWILRRLASHVGQVVTREELTTLLWGEDGLIHQHELDRYVQLLKQKLESEAGDAGSIVTVPGIGYMLTRRRE